MRWMHQTPVRFPRRTAGWPHYQLLGIGDGPRWSTGARLRTSMLGRACRPVGPEEGIEVDSSSVARKFGRRHDRSPGGFAILKLSRTYQPPIGVFFLGLDSRTERRSAVDRSG